MSIFISLILLNEQYNLNDIKMKFFKSKCLIIPVFSILAIRQTVKFSSEVAPNNVVNYGNLIS